MLYASWFGVNLFGICFSGGFLVLLWFLFGLIFIFLFFTALVFFLHLVFMFFDGF